MGFFDALFGEQQPQKPADPALLAVFALPPDEPRYRKKEAEKALARGSDGIMAILHSTGETCLIAAHDTSGFGSGQMVVVTDRRIFIIKNGSVQEELKHEQVAETSIRGGTGRIGNMVVAIDNIESLLEFGPDDSRRFRKCIMAEVGSYRIANSICSYIDERLGR